MTLIHNIRLDSNFTITSNKTPEVPGVSWGAKGLLWYILSRPPGWEIHTWQLAGIYSGEKRGNGKPAIGGFIKELIKAGFLIYKKYQKKNGQWDHKYDAYPVPFEEYQKMFPEVVKPALVKPALVEPASVKQPLLVSKELPSTELTRNKNQERRGEGPPSPPPRSPKEKSSAKKIERAPHVHTTDEEHQKLAEERSEAVRDTAYQVLSEWKEDTPRSKWKKSDFRSVKRWVFKAVDEQSGKAPPGKSNSNKCLSEEAREQYRGRF
jgi:hypothetical protein